MCANGLRTAARSPIRIFMQFLHRNRSALLTVAVLIFSSVMVVRQYLANQSVHTSQVEDFLLLHERNEIQSCEHLYQVLIQQLPRIGDRELVQDLQRTSMIVDPKTPQLENLIWKYQVSVKNELKRRADKRISKLLQSGEKS